MYRYNTIVHYTKTKERGQYCDASSAVVILDVGLS